MKTTLLKNGVVVTHQGIFEQDILVEGAQIAKIVPRGTSVRAGQVIDLVGKHIFPGLIDGHVHFHDPGQAERMEDFLHGTAAAAAGGVTTVISHPLNNPPTTSIEHYQTVLDAYAGRGYIDYALHGGATSANLGTVNRLWRDTGIVSLKMFLCDCGRDFPFVRENQMLAHLRMMAQNGALAIIHAEDDGLLSEAVGRERAAGRKDGRAHLDAHPAQAELVAIDRVIRGLEATGARALILHVGLCEALEKIHAARERGIQIYAESCPHYFTFTQRDVEQAGPFLKFSPVVRDAENRELLWKLLEQGLISTFGSDHSPYAKSDKEAGFQDIWTAPNGIPGIETMLPTLLTGVNEGRVSLAKVAEVTSYLPARLYGLSSRKGAIEPGRDADFAIVDLSSRWIYDEKTMQSPCKWSPYSGRLFQGRVNLTMVRGEIIYQEGKVVGKPGYGIYLPRDH